jgi:broad specificity phosphatase PhoE
MKNILLIRHGQSEANVDNKILSTKSDYAIDLTAKGLVQAKKTGAFLQAWATEQGFEAIQLVNSSFERANQTANAIANAIKLTFTGDFSRRVSDTLVEINFGLYYFHLPKEYRDAYPEAMALWDVHNTHPAARYFCSRPMGESYWDVSNRLQLERHLLCENAKKSPKTLFIVVAHGGVNRCLVKDILGQSATWFDQLDNPDNAEVWQINEQATDFHSLFNPNTQ